MLIFDPGLKTIKWYSAASAHIPEMCGEFHLASGAEAWPPELNSLFPRPLEIGYVLANGAGRFAEAVTEITPTVREELALCLPVWPEVNAATARLIENGLKRYPYARHLLLCETAFFSSLPERTAAYALPEPFYSGVRRRGAGGLTHAWVHRASGQPGRLVSIHLGDQPSVAAIRDGAAVETSAGFTALEGLPGLCTCGDIDPAVVLGLLEQGRPAAEVRSLLASKSGFQVFAPGTGSLEEIIDKEELPFEMLRRGLLKSTGAALAAMGGADCITVAADQPDRWQELIDQLKVGLEFLDGNVPFFVLQAPRARVLLDTMKNR